MLKNILLFLILCIFSFAFAQAQSASVRGKVVDTSSDGQLTNAAVLLLDAKDSMLHSFTRVRANGDFLLQKVDSGKYILLVIYPQYADYTQSLDVAGNDTALNLGTLNLIQAAHLLKDVIVSQKLGSIRIKGDTTEFAADSFKVQPNATVEDLLKKLPGIQIDKDGKITAQGQTVQKVLVDGEEFFGDDPTLVTKNLRADMVDKVQLFDKSSDQAAFTGIDDGNKTKTINIKLKDDKKNGYFGKLTGGIGTDNYRETQDMFNYFKGKMKVSAYATLANTGKMGLGFQDEMKYGSLGSNVSTDVSDGMTITSINGQSDDPLQSFSGQYDGNGIPDVKSGGVHFDNKWNDDKQDINLNYKIGGMRVQGNGTTTTQNNLPTGILYTNSSNKFNNDIFRQKLDGIYDIQLDSLSSLKFTVGGSLAHSTTNNFTTTETQNADSSLVNNGSNSLTSAADTKAFNASMLWRQKFKKKGRTISVSLNEFLQNKDESGFISNHNYFYNGGAQPDSSDLVDQRKTNLAHSNSLNVGVAYTEPLSKTLSLVIDYGLDVENSMSDVRSYNAAADSVYNILDSTYSNHYIYNQLTNSGGVAFNYKKNKLNFNIGTDAGATKYHQINTFTSQPLDRSFASWAPKASLQYKFSQQSSLRFNYNGKTQQPSVTQIQPVMNNNDNLNIYIGNPLLKPSFNNNFTFMYDNYRVLSSQSIFAYGGYNLTVNPVVTNVSTNNTTGASRYTYFNINHSTANYYFGFNFSRKIKKIDLNYNIFLGANGNEYANFINNVMNATSSNSYSLGLRLYKYKEKKYDLSLFGYVGYNTNHSTLQNQINNNSWSCGVEPNFDVFLPAKFQIHTDGDYEWQQKTQTFAARNQFIWNAWIGKKFFKKENLLVKVSANDILNQNNGFSRSAYNNTYTQSLNATIKRYFMLSVEWNFSKMNGAGNK